jgi:peptide/nickel transport system ATP-binding protein
MASPPVLDIHGLTVAYPQGDGWLLAVQDFSLAIRAGQTYGLVGESGSGKSTVALAIMRYLGRGRVLEGQIRFQGEELLALSREQLEAIWGDDLALVPQDPLSALNPSIRIGEQLAEGLRQHRDLDHAQARARAITLLGMVRLPDPQRVAASYPHQLSGGMQQRVMIAMALSLEPALLVLDEPATALDVTTQAAILDLLADLIRERDTATLYVTHNLGVVSQICDRVAVLYAGELLEDAPTRQLFAQPLHPYTRGLIDSVPRLRPRRGEAALQAIPGQIPPLGQRLPACVYADRCPLAIDICREQRPPLDEPHPGRRVRCHRWPEILAGDVAASFPDGHAPDLAAPVPAVPLLSLRNLSVEFAAGRSLWALLRGKRRPPVRAVHQVDLDVPSRQTLGVVGESGSGKTTIARAIVGLQEITGGEMTLLGVALHSGLADRSLETLKQLQIVFQNPEEALNPFRTVGQTLRRPLMRLRGLSRRQADEAVASLLVDVRLPPAYARRLPGQLSGGEKQRVALARAFAANPALLVADEPVSSLDVSVQASVLNLIRRLQAEHHTSIFFISHDLAVVAYLADVIAVVYAGELMEVASTEALLQPPFHPYTEALLAAVPRLDPAEQPPRIRLEGDVASQPAVVRGCPFHPRCPRFLGDICVEERPPWRVAGDSDRIFCHIPLETLAAEQRPLFERQAEEGS